MARCGCSSSAASGVSILDTATVDVSGAGTPASPFTLDAVVSATGGNLLSAVADGLFVDDQFADERIGYTPTWSAAVSAPSIGNGLIAGNYRIVGKELFFAFAWISGSTTNYGSGPWGFSLPAGVIPSGFLPPLVADVVANGQRLPAVAIVTTTTGFTVYSIDDSAASFAMSELSNTFPVAWASGSRITVAGVLALS